MTSFYYYDQNPSGFCFLVQIRAFVIQTSLGLQNLNMKGKTERIMVVVVKWRRRANGLFITAIENIRFEIYLRFTWIQTYRSSWCRIFSSRSRSRELRISSILIFFVYFFHSDIDFTRNRWKFCGDRTEIKSLLRRLKNIGTVCKKLYRNTLGLMLIYFKLL